MPSLNFQSRFADLVASGQKRQTIRVTRKYPIKPGDTLHFFTGMRRPGCRRLRDSAECIGVSEVVIGEGKHQDDIRLDGAIIGTESRAALARSDGFCCTTEMIAWFREAHGLPFEGVVIRW
jgi:hypothetical protein